MIDLILADAKRAPQVFEWNGALERSLVEDWLFREQLRVPPDLIELWVLTGGGLIFESEEILAPWQIHSFSEVVGAVNKEHEEKGKPSNLLIFEKGGFVSAINLLDQKIVTLEDQYKEVQSFQDLDTWYAQTLKDEFGAHYGID